MESEKLYKEIIEKLDVIRNDAVVLKKILKFITSFIKKYKKDI